jgi:hypothetical protein
MAMKPLPSSRTRDASAEHGAMGVRAVHSTKGVESPSQGDTTGARQNPQGTPHRPREERELDEQRRALASMILGVFEADTHPGGAAPAQTQAAAPPQAAPDAAPRAARDPLLEGAIVEFMYALFQALDQIDDAEPTLAYRAAVPGHGAASARSGFGERIDLLASHIAAAAHAPPRLERAHAGVLNAIVGAAAASADTGHARSALAALLRRLANAMHVAPSLGYGASANAGALLRVRA